MLLVYDTIISRSTFLAKLFYQMSIAKYKIFFKTTPALNIPGGSTNNIMKTIIAMTIGAGLALAQAPAPAAPAAPAAEKGKAPEGKGKGGEKGKAPEGKGAEKGKAAEKGK